jgi:ribosomal protein S18 acetylase RimI-like enzyme
MLRIEKANLTQLNRIIALYRACGKKMEEEGFDNWGDFYPPAALIQEDIESEALFCLLEGEELLGVIVLNEVQPAQFEAVQWQYTAAVCLIVHRLAIAVEAQKKGYAKKLMEFAELYALKNAYSAIRLDAYSINEGLLKFYRQLGYQSTKETISLGAKWKHSFTCFEKRVLISFKI